MRAPSCAAQPDLGCGAAEQQHAEADADDTPHTGRTREGAGGGERDRGDREAEPCASSPVRPRRLPPAEPTMISGAAAG